MTAPHPASTQLARIALLAARQRAELYGRAATYPFTFDARRELAVAAAGLTAIETAAQAATTTPLIEENR